MTCPHNLSSDWSRFDGNTAVPLHFPQHQYVTNSFPLFKNPLHTNSVVTKRFLVTFFSMCRLSSPIDFECIGESHPRMSHFKAESFLYHRNKLYLRWVAWVECIHVNQTGTLCSPQIVPISWPHLYVFSSFLRGWGLYGLYQLAQFSLNSFSHGIQVE